MMPFSEFYRRIFPVLRVLLLGSVVVLAGCVPVEAIADQVFEIFPTEPGATITLTPFQPEPSPTPTLTPSPAPIPMLWIAPSVPLSLREIAAGWGFVLSDDPAVATLRLEQVPAEANGQPPAAGSQWVYALVGPFSTLTDGVTSQELRLAWAGESGGPFSGEPLLMDGTTLAAFTMAWGEPGAGAVRIVPAEQLLDTAWSDRPSWGLVPFERLEPRWKVLAVDGQSPIHNDFSPSGYPLKAAFRLVPSDNPAVSLPVTNREANRLTTLVMTGVTALVRATAYKMEINGITYPARDIRDWLTSADITHISNEVPFAVGCPYPDPGQGSLRFCSDPDYIALMEYAGTDVVELTGNHFQDYGSEATLFTLELYREHGWPYFGGGADLADSQDAAILEHNGNRLAFIGCNTAGPYEAWATQVQPGAAPCDWDYMTAEIARLRAEGYIPIVTFQYAEYYVPEAQLTQMVDFRRMAEAGAAIVSGSQAHVPQAMEFYDNDTFIHYGLGNLFFDQMDVMSTRREFIDRHVFYAGRYISTELLSAVLEDFARPRPMTPVERYDFLLELFTASVW